jgi:hypothetical protein
LKFDLKPALLLAFLWVAFGLGSLVSVQIKIFTTEFTEALRFTERGKRQKVEGRKQKELLV